MEISKTLLAKQIKNDRLSKQLPVYDGGLGENPVPQPNCLIEELKKHADKKEYTSATGIKELREILGKNLIVGNGLKPLLFLAQLAFSKIYSNGIILYFTPHWVSYKEQTKILNIKTIDIPNKNYKVTPYLLESVLKHINVPHMIIFNNPNNPSGLIYTNDEVAELCILFKKYNSIVLSDEIYNYLGHNWTKIHSPYVYYDNVIVGNSLSKNFASGGYRFGWLKFPDELNTLNKLYDMCKILASSIYSCPSLVFQYVGCKALTKPPHKEIIESIKFQKMMYGSVAEYCKGKFKTMNLIYTDSNAAWYFLIDFSYWKTKLANIDIHTSDQLNKYLAETLGFITVSGSAFGIKKELVLRYSYVDIKNIDIESEKCDYSNIVTGLEVLHDWLLSI